MPDLERRAQSVGARPALIIVDVIEGFTNPECPLGAPADGVVDAIARLLAAFRASGFPVFYTTVVYHDESQARVFRDRLPALNVLTPDSHWVRVDDRIKPREDEPVLEKRWASSFFGTDLGERLKASGVDSLVVTGLTTSGCVRATAVDGLQNDYPVFVPREAAGDRNPDAHESNLFDLHAKYADVVGVEDLLTRLSG